MKSFRRAEICKCGHNFGLFRFCWYQNIFKSYFCIRFCTACNYISYIESKPKSKQ